MTLNDVKEHRHVERRTWMSKFEAKPIAKLWYSRESTISPQRMRSLTPLERIAPHTIIPFDCLTVKLTYFASNLLPMLLRTYFLVFERKYSMHSSVKIIWFHFICDHPSLLTHNFLRFDFCNLDKSGLRAEICPKSALRRRVRLIVSTQTTLHKLAYSCNSLAVLNGNFFDRITKKRSWAIDNFRFCLFAIVENNFALIYIS